MRQKDHAIFLLFLSVTVLLATASIFFLYRLPLETSRSDMPALWEDTLRYVSILQAVLLIVLVCGGLFILSALRRRSEKWHRQMAEKTKSLIKTTESYQAVVDDVDELIFTLDSEGRYLSMNRYGLTYLQADLSDILGKYVEEHLDARSAHRFREYFQWTLERGEYHGTREPMTINGRERYVDFSLKVLHRSQRTGGEVLAIIRDVTQQKELDDRLWQTEKLASMGLLAAGVAHEVNNPLGILMGFCELMLEKTAEGSDDHRTLAIIYKHSRQCRQIVDRLLNFTRMSDTGSGPGNVLAALQAVVDLLKAACEKKEIVLSLNLPRQLPLCTADEGSMQQIFLNLIGNAMDAMPTGGRLTISAELKTKPPRQGTVHGTLPSGKQYIEIMIHDTGIGIAVDDIDRIFDPFFTTKPVGLGTGLGLSVTYGLVRRFSGTIVCKSPDNPAETDHPGACFTVRFPLAAIGGGSTAVKM